jgi:serine/threonine protein kinase
MNVSTTTGLAGSQGHQGITAPKDEPLVLLKTSQKAVAGQMDIAKPHGIDRDSVISSQGLKLILGKPSIVANMKDSVVHLMHRVSDRLLPGSSGSHYKEALRLADEYQALKNGGGTETEKLQALNHLKDELTRHAPSGSKGEEVRSLVKFVELEMTLVETAGKSEALDGEARLLHDDRVLDVAFQQIAEDRAVTARDFEREIHSFDQNSLKPVGLPGSQGVPEWAKKEFLDISAKNDTIDSSPQGSVTVSAPLLQEPGISSLSDGFRQSPTLTGLGAKLETVVSEGGGDPLKKLAGDFGKELAKDITAQGRLSETAFVISRGDAFKQELFDAIKASSPQGGPLQTGTLDQASPEIETFLNEVYTAMLESFSDKQLGGDKIMLGGKEFTKGELLGEGAFGSVHLYEHQSEVTDPQTGKKTTVVEKVAVKAFMSGSFDEAAAEVRSHQSALGPTGNDNIIGLRGVIPGQDGSLLIALELAGSSAFDTLINFDQALKDGNLSPEAANAVRLTMLKDMMLGLQHFQEQRGMTHLDVKDPNYLVGLDGRTKLADFGTAVSGTSRELKSSLVDNPRWKAPEVVIQSDRRTAELNQLKSGEKLLFESAKAGLNARNLDPETRKIEADKILATIDEAIEARRDNVAPMTVTNKADTWSLGIIAYRMFKGEYPFDQQFVFKSEAALSEFGNNPESRFGELGMDQTGESTGKAVTAFDRLINLMLHPDPTQRASITDLLRNPLFDGPHVGGDTTYELIKELSSKTPDPVKLKKLSGEIGD